MNIVFRLEELKGTIKSMARELEQPKLKDAEKRYRETFVAQR